MKVLITGCGGFAGSHLADYLLGKGEEVIALLGVKENPVNIKHIRKHLRMERVDLRDYDGVHKVVDSTRPQRIYHLAAVTSPAKSFDELELTYQVNFLSTMNLFSAWLRVRMDCRFLLVSSSEVYGVVPPEKLPLREDMEMHPANPYAGSKAAAEILSLQCFQSYGLPIIRVRAFNHTGPRQSLKFVCSDFSRQVTEIDLGLRPPVIKVGNTQVRRDFSDVRDIVRGYCDLLEGGKPGEVYQLCSGKAVSIQTLLELLVSMASKPVQIAVDQGRVRADDSPEVRGDYSKARSAVGWTPRYELETTLHDLKLYWDEALQCRRTEGLRGR